MFLVCIMTRRSVALGSLTITFSLALLVSFQIFFKLRISSLRTIIQSAVENTISPVTAPISSLITRSKLRYFSLSGVTRSCRPRPDLLDGIVIKVPMMRGRYFYFPNKIQGKRFP